MINYNTIFLVFSVHLVVKGQVQELSVYSTGTTVHVLVSHNSSDDKRAGANWMTTFEVSDDIIRGNKLEKCRTAGYVQNRIEALKNILYINPNSEKH